jgi:hypothetical protein
MRFTDPSDSFGAAEYPLLPLLPKVKLRFLEVGGMRHSQNSNDRRGSVNASHSFSISSKRHPNCYSQSASDVTGCQVKDLVSPRTQNPARATANEAAQKGQTGREAATRPVDNHRRLFREASDQPMSRGATPRGVALRRLGGTFFSSPLPQKYPNRDLPLAASRCSIEVAYQAADASLRSRAERARR